MVDQPVNQIQITQPPATLNHAEKQCWDRQDLVIEAYRSLGTLAKAAQAVGLTPDAAWLWTKSNIHDFNTRMERGRQGYRDHLEAMVEERLSNPTGNRGSDVLLMGALNANHPEKWSRNVQVTHEVGQQVLATLQKIQEGQAPKASLEPSKPPWVVEGSVTAPTESDTDA